ncbi:MAG: response regulator [Candidatus Protistobacter heckmanni]|nr:response regulator [Candidatus Protistobacter heckmanni]
MATILVVDDEMGIRELLSEILGDEGHVVELAENAQQAREYRAQQAPDLVLLDIWMPDTDGVTLLKEWSSQGRLTMPVIMMSGHATIDTAVEATRIGALNFLEKPIALQKLLKAVESGLARGAQIHRQTPTPLSGGLGLSIHRTVMPAQPDAMQFANGAAMSPGISSGLNSGLTGGVGGPMGNPIGGPAGGQFAGRFGANGMEASAAAAQPSPVMTGLQASFDLPLRDARDLFERSYFEYHLARENGSMTRVSERSGLERTHLYRKLKQLGIDLSRGRHENSDNSGSY